MDEARRRGVMNYSPRDSGTIEQETKDLHNLINGVLHKVSNTQLSWCSTKAASNHSRRTYLAKIIEDRGRQIHVYLKTGKHSHR